MINIRITEATLVITYIIFLNAVNASGLQTEGKRPIFISHKSTNLLAVLSKNIKSKNDIAVRENQVENTLSKRSLRGGSRSGGRSGGSSNWSSRSGNNGGSKWYHRNNNNQNRNNQNHNRNNQNHNNWKNSSRMGTMKKVLTGLAIGALGLGLLSLFLPALGIGGIAAGCPACCACLAGLCCGAGLTAASNRNGSTYQNNNQGYYYYGEDNDENKIQTMNNEFDAMVQRTKHEVENTSQSYSEAQPYSGVYNTSYIDPDSGVRHDAILNLYFTKDMNGYRISGQGSDIDGETLIEDGFVTNDGSAAWWRERTITGDVGLQVLSKGRFDFQERAFDGVWMANSKIHGSYLSFCASGASDNATIGFDGNPIPIAQAVPVAYNASSAPNDSNYNPPQHVTNTNAAIGKEFT